MEKQAFIELLLNLIGKHGLGNVSKFLNKGGLGLSKSVPGSARRGVANAVGDVGKKFTDAAQYLGKRPVLSDAALGAAFSAIPSGDPEQGYLSRAAEGIPNMMGWGIGLRSLGKVTGPWWEKLKTKRAGLEAQPERLSQILNWLTQRTMLENALVGTAAGAGAGALSDQGAESGLLRGATVGTGVGAGTLAGKVIGEKAIKAFPKATSGLLTVPSAGIAGAVTGGILAHNLYKILAGRKKQAAATEALASILRARLER